MNNLITPQLITTPEEALIWYFENSTQSVDFIISPGSALSHYLLTSNIDKSYKYKKRALIARNQPSQKSIDYITLGDGILLNCFHEFVKRGWETKICSTSVKLPNEIIYFDENEGGMLSGASMYFELYGTWNNFSAIQLTEAEIKTVKILFDHYWSFANWWEDIPEFNDSYFLPQSMELIQLGEERINSLILHLNKNPQRVLDLSSRQFEELIAELLDRQGINAVLTPKIKDGGRDILAYQKTPYGELLTLFECKRYKPEIAVNVQIVRAMYGTVVSEGANAGVIITTSRFTRGATDFANNKPNIIKLLDYEDITKWLKNSRDKFIH